jgi:hypothetical protein
MLAFKCNLCRYGAVATAAAGLRAGLEGPWVGGLALTPAGWCQIAYLGPYRLSFLLPPFPIFLTIMVN